MNTSSSLPDSGLTGAALRAALPASLPSLTGLRWWAAFAVFGFHLHILGYFTQTPDRVLTAFFGLGDSAVGLFFILSGFVLAWSYRRGTNPVTFWWRRLARIWPVHLVAFFLALSVAQNFVPVIRTGNPDALWANAFLVSTWNWKWWQSGNPASWSLCVELFFYALFPLLAGLLIRLNARWNVVVGVGAVAAAFLMPVLVKGLPFQVALYSNPVARFPEFVVGVVAGVLMKSGAWRGPRLWPAGLAAVLALVIIAEPGSYGITHQAALLPAFVLLIAAVARRDVEVAAGVVSGVGARRRVLAHPVMVRLGELSFAFYLVHLLVMGSIGSPFEGGHPQVSFLPGLLLSALALGYSLLLAWMLNVLVEVPARRLMLGQLRRRRPVPTAEALEDSSGQAVRFPARV